MPLKIEFLMFKSLTHPKCHSLTALRVTLQHSIMDPFPVSGEKKYRKEKEKRKMKAKSAVSFFMIELEIYRNMHVNTEMT